MVQLSSGFCKSNSFLQSETSAADEARRKREDNMFAIRKDKKEESLLKKRREGMQSQQDAPRAAFGTMEKKVSRAAFNDYR